MKKQELLVSLLLCFGAILVFFIGLMAGRYLEWDRVRDLSTAFDGNITLGMEFTSNEQLDNIAHAYLDANWARHNMDKISWAGHTTLTPFVLGGLEPGEFRSNAINALQLRSRRELVMPKPEGVYRIFITGGSTAYGSGAPSEETTIAGYLESLLNAPQGSLANATGLRFEVFTAARPAWASSHERIFIENRLSELEPDMVIAFSGNNDVHWSMRGDDTLWFFTYFDQHLIRLVNKVYEYAGRKPMVQVANATPEAKEPSEVARKLAKNARLASLALLPGNARYVLFLQPTLPLTGKSLNDWERGIKQQHSDDGWREDYFSACYKAMRVALARIEEPNFSVVDLTHAFDHVPAETQIFIDSYHFGDRGNGIVAEQMARAIGPLILAAVAGAGADAVR